MLLNSILWDISHGTIIHINVFLAYFLVQEPFFNKNHFLEFLSVGCSVAMQQLDIFAANLSTNVIQTFHACPLTTRKRKRPTLRAIFIPKFHQRNQPHQNVLLHSFTSTPQIFVLKWSKSSASKLRQPWALKKLEPCQFYTFCRESAFQYVRAQGAVPQKLNCVSKIAGHHFPG